MKALRDKDTRALIELREVLLKFQSTIVRVDHHIAVVEKGLQRRNAIT